MPDLTTLLDPGHTVVVTSECQNGVIGAEAIFPALADEVRRAGTLDRIVALIEAARGVGTGVVHCLAHRRADGRGANTNARLFTAAAKAPVTLAPGSDAARLVPELAGDDRDLTSTRLHGIGPMGGTDLDPLLTNLGCRTLVVVGVSVNVAVTNLVMDAVNAGYQVVLPRDAVAGTPADYADAVIDHTLALLATVTDTDTVVTTWRGGS